jgi:hypothetical protein
MTGRALLAAVVLGWAAGVGVAEPSGTLAAIPRPQAVALQAYPALVYVEDGLPGRQDHRSRLSVATFEGGAPRVRAVLESQYLRADPLSDTAFLLEASERPAELARWAQTLYLADLGSSKVEFLSRSVSRARLVHFFCLRTLPGEGRAMLVRYGQGASEVTLLEVDLASLQVTPRLTLPQAAQEQGFRPPLLGLSPDLKHCAVMVAPADEKVGVPTRYSLRLLDLQTMKATELDDDVRVQVSPESSLGWGRPPYEWLNDHEVLYQDMLPSAEEQEFPTNAVCVLKSVDISTGLVSEWLRREMGLTIDGGRMARDPFTGQLFWQGLVVDTEHRTVAPYEPGYSLTIDRQEGTTLRFDGELLFHQDQADYSLRPALSRSRKNLAWFVRSEGEDGSALHVKVAGREPVAITGLSPFTEVVAWVEEPGAPAQPASATSRMAR